MAPARQDIVVQITVNIRRLPVNPPRLKRLVRAVCRQFCLSNAVISIAIVDEGQFGEINSRFLNRKSTSDCLSFDLSEDAGPESERLFEIVVNGDMAVRQAALRGHSTQAELALYVVHGLLHNLGFDDATKTRAGKMHAVEDEILQQFGYGPVYNSRAKTRRRRPATGR